jgi:hypothetical protein
LEDYAMKIDKKIGLNRETLRRLEGQELSQAAAGRAGEDPQPLSAGPSWCGCAHAN